ncbi:MAG: family 20 glycosylhydrolase [Candidatus Eiseniibacteriota bacterium]|nr:MAG: family 20 glycosylhydrolase [Candidatus Eisenbacteria bacterium]
MRTGNNAKATVLALILASIFIALCAGTASAQKYLPGRDFVRALAIPEPVHLKWKTQEGFPLVATTAIVVPKSSSREELELAEWLRHGLYTLFGFNPEILMTDLVPEQNAIIIGTLKSNPSLEDMFPEAARGGFGDFSGQGYVFTCTPNKAFLVGVDVDGLRHGVQTVLQIIQVDYYLRNYVLPPVEIVDFPAHDVRGVLIPLREFRFAEQMNNIRQLIDAAEMTHLNTVFLQVDNAIEFDSFPSVSRPSALAKDTLRNIVQYAREAGMEVIPMVNTFSHQDGLLCPAFPELCLDKEFYDPSKPEVYEKLFPIFDEILEVCQPTYVHIGHDWLRGLARFPKDEGQRLFLEDLKKIYAHLKEKNVQMMMWADMLLAPEKCEGQDNCYGLLGNAYAVIDSLPRDIILIEAHYRFRKPEFPSTDYLLSKGFKVVGCVSNDRRVARDFSKYTAGKSDRFLGMVVALWGSLDHDWASPSRKVMREIAEDIWRGGVPAVDPEGLHKPRNLKAE